MFRTSVLVVACLSAALAAGSGSSSPCPGIKIIVDLIDVVNANMDKDIQTLNDTRNDLKSIPAKFAELRRKIKAETDGPFAELERDIGSEEEIGRLEEAQKKCVKAVKSSTEKQRDRLEKFVSKCDNPQAIESALTAISGLEAKINSVREQVKEKRLKLESMEDQCGKPPMVILNGEIEALLRSRPGGDDIKRPSQQVSFSSVERCVEPIEGRILAGINNLKLFNLACRT